MPCLASPRRAMPAKHHDRLVATRAVILAAPGRFLVCVGAWFAESVPGFNCECRYCRRSECTGWHWFCQPQPFADLAPRVQVHPYPYLACDRAVWGIVARRCASEKGVQPQNLYFGRAVSGSGARAAMLLVAASACARNASSMCQSDSLTSKVHHRRLHFGHLRRRRIYSPWAVAIWVV